MSSLERGPKVFPYLTVVDSLLDSEGRALVQRKIARIQSPVMREVTTIELPVASAPVAIIESEVVPIRVRALPRSERRFARSDWDYSMALDISQVGHPAVWAERTDLMEIYKKYRKNDTAEE